MNSNTIRNGLLRPSVGKAVVGLSLVLNCQAQAALIMDVGSIALNPGQAGQERVFQVENTGGAPVQTLGFQFDIQGEGSSILLARASFCGRGSAMQKSPVVRLPLPRLRSFPPWAMSHPARQSLSPRP